MLTTRLIIYNKVCIQCTQTPETHADFDRTLSEPRSVYVHLLLSHVCSREMVPRLSALRQVARLLLSWPQALSIGVPLRANHAALRTEPSRQRRMGAAEGLLHDSSAVLLRGAHEQVFRNGEAVEQMETACRRPRSALRTDHSGSADRCHCAWSADSQA